MEKQKGFLSSVVTPFISGVLGTVITIGICFNVPSIKEMLIGKTPENTKQTVFTNSEPVQNASLVSLSNYSDTSMSVADKVLPSIVGIEVEFSVTSFLGAKGMAKAQGSGVIISENGYILTNNHIVNSDSNNAYSQVSEANKVVVYLYNDTTAYEAQIIGTDEQTDLAIIKIDKEYLTPIEIGNSDTVKVGEFAMAIGNPLGMQSSVTCGIISAINRNVNEVSSNDYNLIQTDAAINAGNSGGALVNSDGQLIGINTLKFAGNGVEGMGFAIPINATKEITSELIEHGKVRRPYIGITGIDVDERIAKENNLPVGIYVKGTENFGAAEKAGVKVGDVITEVNGQKISTMNELNEIKNGYNIGDTIVFKVYREGKEIEINIILSEQP